VLPDPWATIAELRLFRGLDWKTLTSPGRVQMTILVSACQQARLPLVNKGADSHKVCPCATEPLGHDSRIETFSRSQPKDADISGKGANDHIGLCVSTGSLASG